MRALHPVLCSTLLLIAAGTAASQTSHDLDCGFNHVSRASGEYLAKVHRGEIVPASPPVVMPPQPSFGDGGPGLVTTDDFFFFEDSAGLLLTSYDFADLLEMMVDGANALMVERGDAFDFVGFWINFDPSSTIGAAFYKRVENDVTGLGDVGVDLGTGPVFDLKDELGLAGANIEGFVMMWDINSSHWAPGTGSEADFTRLALGQEYGHRYSMFLDPLLDGTELQGDDFICGRSAHWNWKVDGQGSSMEISEWTGTSPASPDGLFVTFNTDIADSIFAYTDLYLMGYVTPAEMDAGNSELRYMDTSDCASNYSGSITPFGSADIIAANGPRVPDSGAEQHDYRTGWVMIHLPGDEPDAGELQKAADILNQQTADWGVGTLGRGTMDHTLPGRVAFTDLGNGLAGTHGVPSLVGDGTMIAGGTVTLTMSGALENTVSTLFVGLSELNEPFKGGVMVPAIDLIFPGLSTGPTGSVLLSGSWPAGVPSGTTTYYQHWVTDAAGPQGFAASNAISGEAP